MKKQYGVDTDPQKNYLLREVITRLSKSIAVDHLDIVKKPYNYFVNQDKTFNAFCTLGHNISVNSGLFDILNNNENEIAIVIGHEMAHGEHNHSKKSVMKTIPLDILTQLEAIKNDSTLGRVGVVLFSRYAAADLITKPQEWQADNDAFTYTVNAGYNPGAGAAVWQRFMEKMKERPKSFVGEIFSPNDHPTPQQRRDNYAKKMTDYSNGKVKVKAGLIILGGKPLFVPASGADMSSEERAYLIAGNLAAVFHHKGTVAKAVASSGNTVYMGKQYIMTCLSGDPAPEEIVQNINNCIK